MAAGPLLAGAPASFAGGYTLAVVGGDGAAEALMRIAGGDMLSEGAVAYSGPFGSPNLVLLDRVFWSHIVTHYGTSIDHKEDVE